MEPIGFIYSTLPAVNFDSNSLTETEPNIFVLKSTKATSLSRSCLKCVSLGRPEMGKSIKSKKTKGNGLFAGLLPKEIEYSLLAALTSSNESAMKKNKVMKKKKKKKDSSTAVGSGGDERSEEDNNRSSETFRHSESNNRGLSSESARNGISKPVNDTVAERQRLQELVDKKLRQGELLKGRLESLEIKRRTLELRIFEEKKKKKERGGIQATFEQHLKVQSTCKILSSKLDRILVRASKTEAENNSLIRSINEHRKERLIFENMQARLRKQFEEKQRQMGYLLKMSNELNENRLKAHADLEKVIQDEEAEIERSAEEHRELDDIIRKQENLQNELQTASLKRRVHQLQEQIGSGTLDPEEEAKLRARLNVLNAKIERKSHEIETAQHQTIWNFEDAFQKILTEASTEAGRQVTLADAVSQYVQNYDEAFSLLSYVQQVQDENFKLEAQLAARKQEFSKYSREQGKNDANKERIKNELQTKLESFQGGNKKLQLGIESRENTFQALVQTIERLAQLFTSRGVDMPSPEMDADTYHKSVMQTLGQVELKTVEICQKLQKSLALQQMEEERVRSRLASGNGPIDSSLRSRGSIFAGRPSVSGIDLYGGPPSPSRSRKDAEIKIPSLSNSEVLAIFDSKPEHRGSVIEYEPEELDMKVLSTVELRQMVQMSSMKQSIHSTASPRSPPPSSL